MSLKERLCLNTNKCNGVLCEYAIFGVSEKKYLEDIKDIYAMYQKPLQALENKHFETDLLLLQIMETCMTMHVDARTYHDYGYFQFQRGNYDAAMRASKAYLDKADSNDKGALQNDMHILIGLSCAKAIESDPNNSEAYVERSIAYFELGNFDLALSDFLASGTTMKRILSEDPYYLMFSAGFSKGSSLGLIDGAKEMPASLMHTLNGIGRLLWAGVTHPIDTYGELTESAHEMITYLRSEDPSTLAKNMVPELRDLLQQWDSLESSLRGEKVGYILGKYGIEVIIPGMAAKATQKYQSMRRANALCTLETMSASSENRIILEKLAHEAAHQREQFFKNSKIHPDKQGKHVVGHRNYDAKVGEKYQPSIFNHSNPEKLLKEHAGKGFPRTTFQQGQGYKEVVDFKEYIGEFFDEKTNKFLPTTRGTIHYDKAGGVHIVPAPPEIPT